MAKKIPQVWLDWILENVSLGVNLDDIYYSLVQNGFDKEAIDSVLNNYQPKKKLDDSLLDKDKLIKKNVKEFKKRFNEIPTYTEVGFTKEKLPDEISKKINKFYQSNLANKKEEKVAGGYIQNIKGDKESSITIELPEKLRDEIHSSIQGLIEDWSGMKLMPTYVYGVRMYLDGAILNSHKDREETHIIGTIINIDQKVNRDWYLEIEDHKKNLHKVLLEPGEMIFYESATLKHGRPKPLSGEYYSNIFCHYMPKMVS